VIAAGAFSQGVMRWDGVSWSPMGMQALVVSGFALRALAVAPNGDVFVGGLVAMVGSSIGSVWRWDGATWSALPAPGVAGGIHAFAAAANGDLLATGQLNGGVLGRWNGTAWTVSGVAVPASSWPARGTVIELPNGDVVVGGAFASVGGVPASCVARWDGSAWSTFGNGANGNVAAAAVLPGGDLVVGGQFTNTSGAAYVAQVTTTCAATAAPFGTGCAGSGGTNVLGATALPWLGGVHRARATGLPASCIAVRVLGVATLAVPLSAVLPQGLPGCTLLVTPDALDAYVPAGGVLDAALPIPDALPLLGAVLREQVAALELGSNGAIVALSSTNGLTLVLGSF
jgi:hypothetical protein